VKPPEIKIRDVRTDWLRIPLAQPVADASHVLYFIDLILVEVQAGDRSSTTFICGLILPSPMEKMWGINDRVSSKLGFAILF
jgi:hypothetical protein